MQVAASGNSLIGRQCGCHDDLVIR